MVDVGAELAFIALTGVWARAIAIEASSVKLGRQRLELCVTAAGSLEAITSCLVLGDEHDFWDDSGQSLIVLQRKGSAKMVRDCHSGLRS